MTQRRCCCNQPNDPEPGPCAEGCPTPLSPFTLNRWRVEAEGYDIYPSSTSGNMLTVGDMVIGGNWVPDQPLDCMGDGPCGIVPYHRKKVFLQDFYVGDNVCFDADVIREACAEMDHGKADSFFGRDAVEWDGCAGFSIDEDGNWSSSIHFQDTYGDGVAIRGYAVDQKWVPGVPGVSDGHFDPLPPYDDDPNPDCMSVVTVRYYYYNGFVASYYHNVADVCMKSQIGVNVSTEWWCQYARREDSSSKIPTGRYKLMRVDWSGPYPTYKNIPGGGLTVCPGPGQTVWTRSSYDDLGPVTLPGSDTWQPPQYVIVTRLA